MKKIITVILLCIISTIAWTQSFVKIGNTTWATSNVDAPGTFAPQVHNYGKFYQWNKKTAYSTTGSVSKWNTEGSATRKWSATNDPCPEGWQLPSVQQIQDLLAQTKNSWIANYNNTGIAGYVFTYGSNELFFPAAGMRFSFDGSLYLVAKNGFYWTNTQNFTNEAVFLTFANNSLKTDAGFNTDAKTVRCVAKADNPITQTSAQTPASNMVENDGEFEIEFETETTLEVPVKTTDNQTKTQVSNAVNTTKSSTPANNNANTNATANKPKTQAQTTNPKQTVSSKQATTQTSKSTETNENGVKIGNTTWATSNVDDFGRFTTNQHDAGKIYQWNNKKAWNATGTVNGWKNTNATGATWSSANSPCPAGWRIPTLDEQKELLRHSNAWTNNWNNTGVAGRVFTDGSNELFFPATGYRSNSDAMLIGSGTNGYYWSETQYGSSYAYNLAFDSSKATSESHRRAYGRSVRCVK